MDSTLTNTRLTRFTPYFARFTPSASTSAVTTCVCCPATSIYSRAAFAHTISCITELAWCFICTAFGCTAFTDPRLASFTWYHTWIQRATFCAVLIYACICRSMASIYSGAAFTNTVGGITIWTCYFTITASNCTTFTNAGLLIAFFVEYATFNALALSH